MDAAAKEEQVKSLDHDDWVGITEQARRHGLTPLFYDRFVRFFPGIVPDPLCQELKTEYYSGAYYNLKVYTELGMVLRRFDEAGIPVILLKGAYLAEMVYQNISVRPMSDIDLLVKKEHLQKAVDILAQVGYQPIKPFWIETECAVRHHLPALSRPDQIPIEIHWTLAPLTSYVHVDSDGLWQRAQSIVIDGIHSLTLSPEDLLAHLCLHISRDLFRSGVRPLCDIQEVLTNYRDKINWQDFIVRVNQWGVGRGVYLVFRLAQRLLQASVSEAVMQQLQPQDYHAQVEDWAIAQVFEGGSSTILPIGAAHLNTHKPLAERFRLFFRNLFPPLAIIRQKFSLSPQSKRVYCYYFLRLPTLLRSYGSTVWQMFKKKPSVSEPAKRRAELMTWLFLEENTQSTES